MRLLLCTLMAHLCVYPLIDHGQQPMEMHTEVTLYKYIQHYIDVSVLLD